MPIVAERHRHIATTWRMRRTGAVPSRCRGRSPRHEESATEGGYPRSVHEAFVREGRGSDVCALEWKRVNHEGRFPLEYPREERRERVFDTRPHQRVCRAISNIEKINLSIISSNGYKIISSSRIICQESSPTDADSADRRSSMLLSSASTSLIARPVDFASDLL